MRAIRAVLWAVIWAFVGAFALAFTLYVMRARSMPDLALWHQPLLAEYHSEDATASLDAYLAREAQVFEELGRGVEHSGPSGPTAQLNRFNPKSPNNPANRERNWNRSFELAVDEPRGGVLLVHGLSDSPYSLRSAAEIFHERGFWVLGLRMPGHGTLPGELTRATWRDWRDAVRMGARHVAGAVGERPLVLVGYSNGGALVADYAVRVIEGADDPAPAALVMLSPAIGVSPLAAFASVQRVLSYLPGLEKLGWTAILPEYDPYKYNSFPVQAGEQIHELTTQLARAIERLDARERLADFPQTLVFQSVVDATIPPAAVVDRLLSKVPPNGSALVLFDVNRIAQAEPFMRTGHEAFLRSLLEADALPFELTLVTNAAPHTGVVIARTRRAGPGVGTLWTERELGLVWPDGVYSLSHVAIPFPPDDPVYGARDRARGTSPLNLGALDLRGERGVFGVSMDQIMRLRHNPFFPYLRARLEAMIDAL